MTTEEKQFIAGFVDGDGCIQLSPKYGEHSCPTPYIAMFQSHNAGPAPELIMIQRIYGGTLSEKRGVIGNLRRHWELRVSKMEQVKKMLRDLSKHCAIKAAIASVALALFDEIDREARFAHYYDTIRSMKQDYANIIVQQDRVTLAYIAGLFAAEGSIGMIQGKDNRSGAFTVRAQIDKGQCPQTH
jgi:hypothetical protein